LHFFTARAKGSYGLGCGHSEVAPGAGEMTPNPALQPTVQQRRFAPLLSGG
jgi:hypothetical protein